MRPMVTGFSSDDQARMLAMAEQAARLGFWKYHVEENRVYWSGGTYRIHGITRKDTNPYLTLDEAIAFYHPDDQQLVRDTIAQAMRFGQDSAFDARILAKNGEERIIHARGTCEKDDTGQIVALSGTCTDITELRRKDSEAETSQELLQLALRASQDGIWDWHFRTGLLWMSSRWKEMLGYQDHEIPNTLDGYRQAMDPEDYKRAMSDIERYIAGDVKEFLQIQRFRHKDGGWRHVLCRAVKQLNQFGETARLVGANSDITELVEAREEAQKASRMKSEFLTNMSHEIRTPMNAIMGMASLLLSTDLPPKQQGYAEALLRSAENLLDLLNDILDFAKIEAGKIEFKHVPIRLDALMADIAELAAVRARQKRLEFLERLDPSCPAAVKGDAGRLRQVLFNLVFNAIKFTEKGHVLLDVSCVAGEDDARHHITRLRFSVEDTGIGIPENKISDVFEKFGQADGSITRHYGGTGLGLSISSELVRHMNGTMGVESAVGKGSNFWFEVPLAILSEKEGATIVQPSSSIRLDGMHILVVDDSAATLEVLAEPLRLAGAQVITASSAAEAFETVQIQKPDLILLDYSMPDADGDVFASMLQNSMGQDAPSILMVTGHINLAEKLDFEGLGISGCLAKPLLPAPLVHAAAMVRDARQSGKIMEFLTPARLKQAMSAATPKPPRPNIPADKPYILVVEDNSTNMDIILAMLENLGCIGRQATDGLEALEAFRSEAFDLILMDCQMPNLDGLEATRRIRAMEAAEKRTRTTIIALTAHAMIGYRTTCLEAGMDDYIAKPLKIEQLEAMVKKWHQPPMQKISAA